jgi:hypothetical protein
MAVREPPLNDQYVKGNLRPEKQVFERSIPRSSGKAKNAHAGIGGVASIQNSSLPSISEPIPECTDSLLNNVSAICEMVWRRGRRDRLDVPGAERQAATQMAQILGWAESVVLVDMDEGDWIEGDAQAEADAIGRVMRAGKSLCEWLDDLWAVEEIESLA